MKVFYKNTSLFSLFLFFKIILVNWLLFVEIWLFSLWVELCLIILLMCLIEILSPHKIKSFIYFSLTIFISILYLSVVIYHDYYGAIITYSALKQAGQLGEVTSSILSLMKPIYLLFFIDIPIMLLLLRKRTDFHSNITKRTFALLGVATGIIVFVNMLFQPDIVNEKKKAQALGMINYQLYTATKPLFQSIQENNTHISQSLINEIKNIRPTKSKDYFGEAKGKNVIVIQLEAFQNFPINKTIGGNEITPNLNKLIKNSIYFSNFYQQVCKGNTSDAEFVLNTSIYPLGNVAMSQEYGKKDIPSLPKLLDNYGYTSLTFHTNDVTFWNRDKLYQALGFDEIYDKKYFGSSDVIAYGASDEILYNKSLERLKALHQKGEKFYANLISMSGHHPFKIPADKPQLPIPKEYQETSIGAYIQAVHYADYAVGDFIEKLKENKMWEDTLLIIFGDHYGLQIENEKERKLIKKLLGREYHKELDGFNTPLIISLPWKNINTLEKKGVSGQIDLMPTIAGIMGIPLDDHIHFGQDLFNNNGNLIGNRFYVPTGTFLNEEILFIPGEQFDDGTATSIETHQQLNNYNQYKEDFRRVLQLMNLSDLYIDRLPEKKE